jgi:transcriptional regulator GlxA family with amidase domain
MMMRPGEMAPTDQGVLLMSKTAQVVLFDGFDPLDAVAPFEVLAAGCDTAGDGMHIAFVSGEGPRRVVSGTRGMALDATGVLDPTLPGYVVVPGASGPTEGDPDDGVETIPVLLGRFANSAAMPLLKHALENPEITVVTVCGGSLAMAMAGLLDGRHAVTHPLGMDVLDATGAHAIHARVVDDGDLITGSGVTSGLDVGLYVLERDYGADVALAVEKLFVHERRGITWRRPAAAHNA